jgi:hypothetical protein
MVPYASFSTHASFRCHWWTLEQAGQSSGIMIPESDSNLIFSVVSPVGTGIPRIGQRIMMLGIMYPKTNLAWRLVRRRVRQEVADIEHRPQQL